jgi:hypothetical protein
MLTSAALDNFYKSRALQEKIREASEASVELDALSTVDANIYRDYQKQINDAKAEYNSFIKARKLLSFIFML